MDNFRCRSRIRYKTLETEGHPRTRHRRFHQDFNNNHRTFHNDFTQQETHTVDDEFVQECLRSHNHFRAQHGCSPLHISLELSKFSQQWADRISREDHLYHSHHTQYGENLFVTYLSDNSLPMARGSEVVDSWYSEHRYYPFNGNATKETLQKAGHFTQVVWNNSRELGLGKAVSGSNRVYVVANYYPAGNVVKKFSANVPKRILPRTCASGHHYSNRLFTRETRFHFDSWIEC